LCKKFGTFAFMHVHGDGALRNGVAHMRSLGAYALECGACTAISYTRTKHHDYRAG
jgi:hypothetical protein